MSSEAVRRNVPRCQFKVSTSMQTLKRLVDEILSACKTTGNRYRLACDTEDLGLGMYII